MNGEEDDWMPLSCLAPSYNIAAACASIGFERPLDVAWAGTDQWDAPSPKGVVHCHLCHSRLPKLEKFRFTLAKLGLLFLWLCQCPGCKTIYFEED